ncbi:hypothetical protein OOT46_15610 [Aquabacterium sp. A7-Y]|uniref:hypothetical protein n=1 Tax=Aquabacterium sp. A7-Y TaxID=1349605 RepID=UPI00223C9754|nr:hypothetical protein [Aquabacterium sp. A7-Y]MCW7539271.1 hypothetical protein [Aquabacterium sp. A7-Y]
MDKTEHPETMGVFKPVGHVVISFRSESDADNAVEALADAGFSGAYVVRYTPEQMKVQVERDIAQASPLASLGQELNLVKAHGELAEKGYHFLVVHAPKDEETRTVGEIARSCKAERAQKYGSFVIEELIEVGSEPRQVFESPDRGLDAQTRSGREGQHR